MSAASKLVTVLRGAPIAYSLYDTFTTAVGAGSVNGTTSESPFPTGGGVTRTATDTGSRLSIANGTLTVSGGADWGDPGLWSAARTRAVGLVFKATTTLNAVAAQEMIIGFSTAQSGAPIANSIEIGLSKFYRYDNSAAAVIVGTSSAITAYTVALVLRTAGAFYFAKGGAFTNWTLLWVGDINTTGTVYPAISNNNATYTADNMAVHQLTTFPAPLVSDGFGGTRTGLGSSDGLGHAEGVNGGLGTGGGSIAWTNRVGTSGVSGGVASSSALTGGIAIETVDAGSADVWVESDLVKGTSGIGMALRYVDTDNYLYCYHDGTNAALLKRVAGVEANVIAPTAATYSAGARMKVVLSSTSADLYYNNAKVGSTGTVPVSSATLHGLYNLSTDSTMDNFTIRPRGTGGEWNSTFNPI